MDVFLTQGAAHSVRIEADKNLLPYIETEMDGDELEIGSRRGYNLRPRAGIKIYVTAPAYEEVQVSGSGDIVSQTKLSGTNALRAKVRGSGDIKLDVDVPQTEAEIAGSGTIILTGKTRNVKAGIMGSGDIKGFDLLSEAADVDIAGSGNAQVFASKQLNVDVKGSGDVQYKGNPAVNQRIAGSGGVRKVD